MPVSTGVVAVWLIESVDIAAFPFRSVIGYDVFSVTPVAIQQSQPWRIKSGATSREQSCK